jgi:integrase
MAKKYQNFELSPAQRADAREALKILEGSTLTLTAAAIRALQGKRALRRVCVAEAVGDFLRTRLALRARTFEWYESNLKPLTVQFGDDNVDEVDRARFVAWVKPMSDAERRRITRAARAFFRWCAAQEPQIATVDPTHGIEVSSQGSAGEAEFLTVAEVDKVMKAAGRYQSALALLLFAGIRPEELAGRAKDPLRWKHVRTDEKMIRIPAEISKTGKPRIIEGIPETVWRWLDPKGDHVPVSPGRTRQALRIAQAAIAPREWPRGLSRRRRTSAWFNGCFNSARTSSCASAPSRRSRWSARTERRRSSRSSP